MWTGDTTSRVSLSVSFRVSCICCFKQLLVFVVFLLTCHCRKISGWKREEKWWLHMLMSCPVVSGNVPCGLSGFLGQGFHRILQVLKQIEIWGFGALLSWTLNNQTNIYINPNSCRTLCCNNINNVTTTQEITAKPFGWIWIRMQNKSWKKKTKLSSVVCVWFIYNPMMIKISQ